MSNEHIKLTRNQDYWKPGLPYLDGIEFIVIKDSATAVLAFVAGKLDFAGGLQAPNASDIKSQVPDADCLRNAGTGNGHLIINRAKPPFNDPELRRAMSLTLRA